MDSSYHCRLTHPFRLIISGPSNIGKSYLVNKLILNHDLAFENTPTQIYFFFKYWQQNYEELKNKSLIKIVFIKGEPDELFKPIPHALIIFDDLLEENSTQIRQWFQAKSHHHMCDIVYVIQNLYSKNSTHRDISLSANYLVIFRNVRDNSAIAKLNYDIFGAGKAQLLANVFKETFGQKYRYILFDLDQGTPENFRLRSSLFPQADKTLVYVPL